MAFRYALYVAPRPGDGLASFANSWLGRDAERGIDIAQPEYDGLSRERLMGITAEPRRYGFHGTLKPPFRLASGATADTLIASVAEFARQRAPIIIPRLRLASLGGFLALVPVEPVAVLDLLAADCMRTFDNFCAPLDESELARRRKADLTARQDALLRRWGYPYVLDEFRFHLTLTGRLDEAERGHIYRVLEQLTSRFCVGPLKILDLVVFAEEEHGSPFRVLVRFPFSGG